MIEACCRVGLIVATTPVSPGAKWRFTMLASNTASAAAIRPLPERLDAATTNSRTRCMGGARPPETSANNS
jgi:hypothetical protein